MKYQAAKRCLFSAALLALSAGTAAASDCEDSQSAATTALSVKLVADLDLATAEYRRDAIKAWRIEYEIPLLLADELMDAKGSITANAPLAEQAENDYEEALYNVEVDCRNDG